MSAAAASGSPLLSIRDLHVSFRLGKEGGVVQRVEAVKGVSFDVPENTIKFALPTEVKEASSTTVTVAPNLSSSRCLSAWSYWSAALTM